MGDSGDGIDCLTGDGVPLESVTGVAGPVLLAATVPDLARGDVLAGRYQIEAVIGSGGSGRVLRAFDRVTRTAVALKILRAEYAADPVWNERFSRELRVGRQIQHLNVCRVYDIGDSDGHKFLSMELATGGTVRSQLAPGAPPRSVDDRIADARAIIQGVAALHAAGIVHRDLKPENILRAADGRLLVSDFGLATDPGAGPATTIMIGTPRYMAPEVVMGDPATVRSDVWALGVVMHEILSGERPNRSLIKRRRRTYTPPEVGSPRERRLVELCARCSEEDPEDRPASAVEMRREFEAAVSGRRISTRTFKKQIAWAVVAIAALASLGVVRNRWTSNAVASSSQLAASSKLVPSPQPVGPLANWDKSSRLLASFDGTVHCFLPIQRRGTVRVVWGSPRRVAELEADTGRNVPVDLAPGTYDTGCPQLAADGSSLLFEKMVDGIHQIFWSPSPSGATAQQLVRGNSPLWLPNGEEFVFHLDSSHSAIFSLRTKQFTVVGDDGSPQAILEGATVNSAGTRLALLYTGEAYGSQLVLRSLPGLELIGRMSVPAWSQNPRFERESVLLSTFGDGVARRLVSAEIGKRTLRNVAEVPGWDVREYADIGTTRLVESRKRSFDLWRLEGSERIRLTHDGQSIQGSLSAGGALAIQRVLPDGREVIVVRDREGKERQLTPGPSDLTPAFLQGDNALVFARLNSGQLMTCPLKGQQTQCSVIHTDAAVPGFPTPDPSGRLVAYITVMKTPRARIVSLVDGKQRDLGPALTCRPFWTSPTRLWVVVSNQGDVSLWAELDVASGRSTGATRSTKSSSDEKGCRPPDDLQEALPGGIVAGSRVVSIVQETTRLTAAPDRGTF